MIKTHLKQTLKNNPRVVKKIKTIIYNQVVLWISHVVQDSLREVRRQVVLTIWLLDLVLLCILLILPWLSLNLMKTELTIPAMEIVKVSRMSRISYWIAQKLFHKLTPIRTTPKAYLNIFKISETSSTIQKVRIDNTKIKTTIRIPAILLINLLELQIRTLILVV